MHEWIQILHLEVTVASLGNEKSEDLLLVEDRGKVVRILAPGHVALVVSFEGDVHLLVINTVRPMIKIFYSSYLGLHYLCIF